MTLATRKSSRQEITWKQLREDRLLHELGLEFEVDGHPMKIEEANFQIDRTIISVRSDGESASHFITAYLIDEMEQYSYLLESYTSQGDNTLHFLEFGPVHPQSTCLQLVIRRWSMSEVPRGSTDMMTVISPFDGPRAMTIKGDIEPGYRFPRDVIGKLRETFGDDFQLDLGADGNEKPLFTAEIKVDRTRWRNYYYEIPIHRQYSLGGLSIDFQKISGWRAGIRLHYKTSFPTPLSGSVEKRWHKCWESILEIIRKGRNRDEILGKADPVCRYHPTQEGTTSISFRISTDQPVRQEDKNAYYHTISPYEEWVSHFLRISLLMEYAEFIPLSAPKQVFINPIPQEIPLEMEFSGINFSGTFIIHDVKITGNSITITHESRIPPAGDMEIHPAFELIDEKMNRYFLTSRSLPIDYESDTGNRSQLVKSTYGPSPLPHVILDGIKTPPKKLVLQFKWVNVQFLQPLIWNLL